VTRFEKALIAVSCVLGVVALVGIGFCVWILVTA